MTTIKKLITIENIIRIIAISIFIPLWLVTMYYGVIKLGFTNLGY